MSERRKKRKEKQDDWLDALTALHMNVAQSEKATELRDSMNSFLKEYSGMLKEEEKEMLRETLQGIRKTEGVLKRIGGSYAGWHFRDFLFASFSIWKSD